MTVFCVTLCSQYSRKSGWDPDDPDDHASAGYKLGEHFALDYFFEVFTVYGYYHGLRILPRLTDTIKV